MIEYTGRQSMMEYLDWLEEHLAELTEDNKKTAIKSLESVLYVLNNLKEIKVYGPAIEEQQRARYFLDKYIPIWGLEEFHKKFIE
jgi:hypothetical protein